MFIFYSILSILIGLSIGSFINALEWRLHREESLLSRSYCPQCKKNIAWYDNIPLLSFIILRSRCRHCQAKISWQYPLIELLVAVLFFISFLINYQNLAAPLELLRNWLLIFTFVTIFIYDLKYMMVPMVLVWPMIIVAIVINFILGITISDILFHGSIGLMFFALQYLITRGRGIGSGDIWLGLLMGVSLAQGKLLFLALVLAYFSGTIISFVLILKNRKSLKSKIALGPFLAMASIISLILGQNIIQFFIK